MEKPQPPIWFENGYSTKEQWGAIHFGPRRIPTWVFTGSWFIIAGILLLIAMVGYFATDYTLGWAARYAWFTPLGWFLGATVIIGGTFGITLFISRVIHALRKDSHGS
ncbi:membrane protein [Microbacterium phage Zooman]|nr:membrane protein [Microbacterium phage Zooman]